MFTFRNLMAVGLFLFGTTFLWMTAAFAGRTPPPEGMAWTIENILAVSAIVLFSATGWAVFKDASWWELAAIAASIVGLIAVIPYVAGISGIGGFADSGVEINLVMHAVGSVMVLALVVVPAMHDWVAHSL
jgi:hypothetical protein